MRRPHPLCKVAADLWVKQADRHEAAMRDAMRRVFADIAKETGRRLRTLAREHPDLFDDPVKARHVAERVFDPKEWLGVIKVAAARQIAQGIVTGYLSGRELFKRRMRKAFELFSKGWEEAQHPRDARGRFGAGGGAQPLPTKPHESEVGGARTNEWNKSLEIVDALQAKLDVVDQDSPSVAHYLEDLSAMPKSHQELLAKTAGGICVGDRPITEQDHMQHLKGVQPSGWPSGYTWDDAAGMGISKVGDTIVLGKGLHGSVSVAWHEAAHGLDTGGKLLHGQKFSERDAGTVAFEKVRQTMVRLFGPYTWHYQEAFAEGYAVWGAGKLGRLKDGSMVPSGKIYTSEDAKILDDYFGGLKI